MSLQGKTAIVTGGASGIGLAVCQCLAREGASVAIWDLDEAGAQGVADEIAAAGGRAVACRVDVSNREQVNAATRRVREELGPINIIVNNAGFSELTPFMEITDEVWDRMMTINLKGVFICTQAALPDMLETGWGRIINISSSSAQTGSSRMTHYAASKGGVIGLTKSLAMEYAEQGITANNVPPGFVDTPMLRKTLSEDQIEYQRQLSPMKTPGRPEHVAAACAFLASEDARSITGHTFSVNGGRYVN